LSSPAKRGDLSKIVVKSLVRLSLQKLLPPATQQCLLAMTTKVGYGEGLQINEMDFDFIPKIEPIDYTLEELTYV
jgi:hypothetical protein